MFFRFNVESLDWKYDVNVLIGCDFCEKNECNGSISEGGKYNDFIFYSV